MTLAPLGTWLTFVAIAVLLKSRQVAGVSAFSKLDVNALRLMLRAEILWVDKCYGRGCQGSTKEIPKCSKSIMLRVTNVRSCASAVAATKASIGPIAWPLLSLRAMN